MSIYSGIHSSASQSEFSMGEVMRRGGTVINAGSATFEKVSAELTQRVREELAAEQQRRADAQGMPMPYAVSADEMSLLQKNFPEFTFISTPLWNGVHVGLEAERMAATALCLQRLSSFTGSIVALGNAVLASAFLRLRGVHLEMSGHNAYAVHANHTAQSLYTRMAHLAPMMQQEYGFNFDAGFFKDFIRGRIFQLCDRSEVCGARGEAFFCDLSIYPMSVRQACSAMAGADAAIGEFCVPYTADMLIHPSGEWGSTGVAYEITQDELIFKYPEGVAGANRFSLGAWLEWLRSGGCTVVCDGKEYSYEVELSGTRGSFLYASVTRVDAPAPENALAFRTHALELPSQSGRYFVRSFRLKSLTLDPTKRSSYEPFCYTPDARVADKVFAHALSLPKESFKDATVFKRVTVLDGRITFAGTSVSVERPVAMEEVAQLTQDVVLRAFVARYNMGQLGSDLMGSLNSVKGFASATTPAKLAYLSCAFFRCAWNWTLGSLVDSLKGVMAAGLRMLSGRGKVGMPEFSPAPTFVLFETYKRWLSNKVYSRVADNIGGNLMVPYLRGARIAFQATNRYIPSSRPVVPVVEPPQVNYSSCELVDDIQDTRVGGEVTTKGAALVAAMSELNGVGRSPDARFDLPMPRVPEVGDYDFGVEDYVYDPNYVQTLSHEHSEAFPGMGLQNFEGDQSSLMFDPQDWNFDVNYMRMPLVGQRPPRTVEVYKSKCHTYRVERKMQTLQQLMFALGERNIGIPNIADTLNVGAVVEDTWENFLNMCCKDNARELLAEWKVDRVGFEAECLAEWTQKANGSKVDAMLRELATEAKSLEEYNVADFATMVKSDAKPPLGIKPIGSQVAPQVIVYHNSILSAVYSSIFRVLARRFIALLKPTWMVNLLKDTDAVRRHFTKYYPWDAAKEPQFLENDFGKFDKSQGEVCVRLEQFVNEMLGFDYEMMAAWYKGHERSTVHSVQHALSLVIDWQRRSGGGNTSFGNATINVLTTAYVYRGSNVIAAAYIGDDSIIMCDGVAADERSVRILAEMYNLQAKFILSDFPYFASTFILFDKFQRQALLVADPYKRAERVGLSVNAKEPNWDDRVRSHVENCYPYKFRKVQKMLEPAVVSRYELPKPCDVPALLNALATSGEKGAARDCWEANPTEVAVY